MTLAKIGLDAEIALDGNEVIEIIGAMRFDLILMDCQMPGLDGLQATKIIRDPQSSVYDPNIPIIALTADTRAEYREQCLAVGMSDFLSKPFKPKGFAAMIHKWTEPGKISLERDFFEENKKIMDVIFDREGLMQRVMDDEVFAQEFIHLFLQEYPLEIKRIKDQIEDPDLATLTRQAHSMKSMAANVGACLLQKITVRLEVDCRSGDLSNAVSLIKKIEEQFQAFIEEVEGS